MNLKSNTYLGIDIGATKTIFLLVKITGVKYKILETIKIATPKRESEILKMIEKDFNNFSKDYRIKGVGIGFAGPVDFERGAAIMGPNLKTGKIEFKKVLENKLKIPVAVDNDIKCFLLAESAFGAAKGKKNVVGLTLGTGIGGAIMIEGKIYRGANNFAGEVGHTEIGKDAEIEATASGRGLTRIYQEFTGKNISSFEIVELAKKGDAKALEVIDRVSKILGMGIASLMELLNPEIVILGGGLSEVDLIVNKAKEYAKNKVFLPSLAKTPVVVSNLGQFAVALGAAWMAKENKK